MARTTRMGLQRDLRTEKDRQMRERGYVATPESEGRAFKTFVREPSGQVAQARSEAALRRAGLASRRLTGLGGRFAREAARTFVPITRQVAQEAQRPRDLSGQAAVDVGLAF